MLIIIRVDLPSEEMAVREGKLAEADKQGMLVVPYNYDCNDGKFHMAPGFVTSAGQMYEDYLKSTFDCLYREGGKMMNIPLVSPKNTGDRNKHSWHPALTYHWQARSI